MDVKAHWETVYTRKAPTEVSWFQPHAERSLGLIRLARVTPAARIIDVGGGASTLVDDLLAAGYRDVTVLDVAAHALAAARERLGARAAEVRWIEADVLTVGLPRHGYDVWHDRAVFHFLTDPADRQRYVRQVLHAVRPGGIVIVATFAPDGPERCSGLPVVRYDPQGLHAEFGAPFELIMHEREAHHTPAGAVQQFIYCLCRKALDDTA
ncbi:MAG: class I SAM-dependent methyltransferase [Thiobacillaceae bacterium]|nr:class I SAM-dependent methyltransferase [Thiobacillaceae bacterium]MCX7672128.1 class I SAM-dependent methyltransferase [Thiobacillaceae bacterium]MDW8324485.1 class I SAM-dependent methyltransferase [Burkholderiales bacterium]